LIPAFVDNIIWYHVRHTPENGSRVLIKVEPPTQDMFLTPVHDTLMFSTEIKYWAYFPKGNNTKLAKLKAIKAINNG